MTKDYEDTRENILKIEKESKSFKQIKDNSNLLKDALSNSIASIERIPQMDLIKLTR